MRTLTILAAVAVICAFPETQTQTELNDTGADAASVAGLLITTEAMIAEAPKKESGHGGMPGGGMGDMDF